jgi:Raf kinase inhibitor-like YbhB/YbcL family protein
MDWCARGLKEAAVMLEHVPTSIGHALAGVRAGLDHILSAHEGLEAPQTIHVRSTAFSDGGVIPATYTADGAGLSPPLAWSDPPPETRSVIVAIEDADSPTPAPIVHALVFGLHPSEVSLVMGALPSEGGRGQIETLGHNSFGRCEYLPPDPPNGHGPHRYVVQVFAIDEAPPLRQGASKHDIIEALRGHVVAHGSLVGVYERPAAT